MTASRQPVASNAASIWRPFSWRGFTWRGFTWRKSGAILCLLLLIGFSTAVLVHTHPENSPETSAHCQLCFAAHAPAASAQPLAIAPQIVSRPTPPPAPALQATRAAVFDLNIRPPPALLISLA
jgi:hypothetical protein